MQVHYDIENLPVFRNAVITIGTFDGVHLGHQQILTRLVAEAAKINGESVIITFHPHPRKVISSAILGVRLINTLDEKIILLKEMNIDHLVVAPFTDAFANQPAEDYIKNFLIEKFQPHTIIIGFDHRFGRERLGDYRLLEKLASVYNYSLKEIPKHILDEISISSTNIREAILHNDVDTANKLLGHEFFFEGEVIHGNKLGRKLGYPTANLKVADEEKIIPGDGIYAVYVDLMGNTPEGHKKVPDKISSFTNHDSHYKGMMSIGFRPTVDGKSRVIEVNIFDFDKEIYGKTIRVFIKKFLRSELKFDTMEDLVLRIDNDKIESLKIL